MKLGFGLYRHMLTKSNYNFAIQCGATHLVIHLLNGSNTKTKKQPIGNGGSSQVADTTEQLWTLEQLLAIKKEVNESGLELYAIENFDPVFWYDILLDGPRKDQQMDGLKELIRRVGAAGIPCFGYDFSIAGVCSRVEGPFARGGAIAVGMDGVDETPLPKGMVWDIMCDENAPSGVLEPTTHEQLWQRLDYFLKELLPVAEEAGVKLAAHPDDPPMPTIRQTPRLVYQPQMYQRLLDISDSPSNMLEFCLGTIAEMTEGDIYEATDQYSRQNKIAYVHFRNVRGKVPYYREVFVDEGDIEMLKILRILKKNNYEGVIIPDHAPHMNCSAPWHAGMAHAMGYIKSAMQQVMAE